MPITIIEKNGRFGCRAGAIIFNEDKSKVLLENQENKRYVFPGGRIDINEDSLTALTREIKEELNIKLTLNLKYILEMILNQKDKKYHEIGFYYLSSLNEEKIKEDTKSLDGSGKFEWIEIEKLENYNIIAKPLVTKIKNHEIKNNNLEHIVYKEK